MTKEYLDLKLDFMFKQLFGHSSRKTITIPFLNDLLGRKVALKMLQSGLEKRLVIEMTNLSEEEIQELEERGLH